MDYGEPFPDILPTELCCSRIYDFSEGSAGYDSFDRSNSQYLFSKK